MERGNEYKEFLLSLREPTRLDRCETMAAMVAVFWASHSDYPGSCDPSYVARAYGRAQESLKWLADMERAREAGRC